MSKETKCCLNCNNEVYDKFCSKCGQSIQTSRVNSKEVFSELGYGLFHLNSGLFYTAKELLLRPAVTVRNYLSGKRVGYVKPFILLILCGVIYSFVFHFFHFFQWMRWTSMKVMLYLNMSLSMNYIRIITHWCLCSWLLFMLCSLICCFTEEGITIWSTSFYFHTYQAEEFLFFCCFILLYIYHIHNLFIWLLIF